MQAYILRTVGRVAAAAVNGELYAIGGCPESEIFLTSVEKYNPISREWAEIQPMKYARGVYTY